MIKKIINKYITFFKYLFSAGLSFLLDLILFTVFKIVTGNIIASTYIARAISSLFNYFLNRNKVFNDDNKKSKTIIKYYMLVVIQASVSGILVSSIYSALGITGSVLHIPVETIIKVPVEVVLFIVNFFVQKYFIFNKKEIKINHNLYSIILGILTTLTVLFDLDKKTVFHITKVDTNVFVYLVLGLFLIYFYKKYLDKYKSNNIFKLLSLLFSLFMVVGYSYDKVGNAYLVCGNLAFIIVSIIKLFCFYKLFDIGMNLLFDKVTNYHVKDFVKESKFIKWFNDQPFLVSFIIIVLCYIPYMIAFYPAIMGYDPSNQIREFMGMHTRYMDSVILLDPNVTITNFNPVLHTLLLGSCFKLGHTLGSDNLGLFIYSVIQIILMVSILSYSISYMKKNGVANKLLFIVLGIYALVPVFPFYALSTNKDTIFCSFVLLFVIKLYDLIVHKQSTKQYIVFFLVMLLVVLSRNNGIYTIMLSVPFTLIWLKDKRKPVIVTLLCLLVCYTGYNKVILPTFKISNTSIREMLSIPFQQTARLDKYHPEFYTEEEKETLDNILGYDTLGERYNPELSDPVKNKFNIYTTNSELIEYFKIWGRGLISYPDIYIDSTINNTYGYFYPDTSSWYLYTSYNNKLKLAGFDYHFNSLKGLRNILVGIGNAYPYLPVIGLFVNIAFVGWIYMYLTGCIIIKKKYKLIPFMLPALSFILTNVAGPANTYFRYALPYIFPLPFVLCMMYYLFRNREKSSS